MLSVWRRIEIRNLILVSVFLEWVNNHYYKASNGLLEDEQSTIGNKKKNNTIMDRYGYIIKPKNISGSTNAPDFCFDNMFLLLSMGQYYVC